jgi:pilus assembly protein CpaF
VEVVVRTTLQPAFGRNRAATAAIGPSLPVSIPTLAPEPAHARSAGTRPELTIAELRAHCLARIDPAAVTSTDKRDLAPLIEKLISDIATDRRIQLNAREQSQLAEDLVQDMLGLGPLEPLLRDETVNDILINGPDRIFIERRGKLELSGVRFRDAAHLTNVCQRIAADVGRRVDESSPMVDARLKDGSRVNIVLHPIALGGPYVSIRKFGTRTIDLKALVGFGAMTEPVARVLELAAMCRLNVIISGGTGSGKTTLLNAMSQMIAADERIVTVEDAAELKLQQPHIVRLETRPSNLEGKGEITQRDLVRNALRMRPDRIIIGEVRGSEAFDMLQAMNTGHDGSMSTIHANTARDALTRMENMVQMGQLGLPSLSIRTQINSAVQLIVQVERQRDGGRRVTQVAEVCGMEGEIILLNDVFRFTVDAEDADGRLVGHYTPARARPGFASRLQYFGVERAWMAALEAASA